MCCYDGGRAQQRGDRLDAAAAAAVFAPVTFPTGNTMGYEMIAYRKPHPN